MIDDGDEERAKVPRTGADDAGAEDAQGAARIPAPSPEEVPELLGERSDYPVPFGEESERGAAERRTERGDRRRSDAP